MAEVSLHHLAVGALALPHVTDPVDDLDARRLQQRVPAHRRRTGRFDACPGDARHPVPEARSGRPVDGHDRVRIAAGAAARVFHDEAAVEMTSAAAPLRGRTPECGARRAYDRPLAWGDR